MALSHRIFPTDLLKIISALPEIFKRGFPSIEETSSLRQVASILTVNRIDVLPIEHSQRLGTEDSRHYRAISGRGLLSALIEDPENIEDTLSKPCGYATQQLATVPAENDLSGLFSTFAQSQFGFAFVLRGENGGYPSQSSKSAPAAALVTLKDMLALYRKGIVTTDLLVQDVATSVKFSLPAQTTLLDVVKAMIREGRRRVFVGDTDKLVTDRMIIGVLMSPAERVASGSPLDLKLEQIEAVEAKNLYDNLLIRDSIEIFESIEQECVLCDEKVVTLWDITMKPWLMQHEQS